MSEQDQEHAKDGLAPARKSTEMDPESGMDAAAAPAPATITAEKDDDSDDAVTLESLTLHIESALEPLVLATRSAWETDSTTPMTTRPYFLPAAAAAATADGTSTTTSSSTTTRYERRMTSLAFLPPLPRSSLSHRRTRSRSLGSSLDTAARRQLGRQARAWTRAEQAAAAAATKSNKKRSSTSTSNTKERLVQSVRYHHPNHDDDDGNNNSTNKNDVDMASWKIWPESSPRTILQLPLGMSDNGSHSHNDRDDEKKELLSNARNSQVSSSSLSYIQQRTSTTAATAALAETTIAGAMDKHNFITDLDLPCQAQAHAPPHDEDLHITFEKVALEPFESPQQQRRRHRPSTAIHTNSNTTTGNPIWVCVLYGCINATIILPILMSFGSIIYRDNAFAPYRSTLTKLTVFSGIVHQVSFSTVSSLPFAVGQVQDAGLIFLSSMASSLVQYCRNAGHDDETMLATVTVSLSLATAILGLALVFIGASGCSQWVQLLPTSVVGGYLAYIGWFCGISGIGIMNVITTDSLEYSHATAHSSQQQYYHATTDAILLDLSLAWRNLPFTLPGIVGGSLIYLAIRRFRHMAVLPVSITVLLTLFYVIVYLSGSSIDQVTEQGWIRSSNNNNNNNNDTSSSSSSSSAWYHTWDYLQISKVDWSALPGLALTELSMIFVVALGSSLDVAAIELELQQQQRQRQKRLQQSTRHEDNVEWREIAELRNNNTKDADTDGDTTDDDDDDVQEEEPIIQLDYNRELKTVGISNILSGLSGGYTGSYIFSQSIFSLRAGIHSRLAGFVLAGVEWAVITAPVNVLALIPNFFFGSLLVMICIDLLYEWLYDIRQKVSSADYAICWFTFAAIQVLSVEYGIMAGVALYALCRHAGVNLSSSSSSADPMATATTAQRTAHNDHASTTTTGAAAGGMVSIHDPFEASLPKTIEQDSEEESEEMPVPYEYMSSLTLSSQATLAAAAAAAAAAGQCGGTDKETDSLLPPPTITNTPERERNGPLHTYGAV